MISRITLLFTASNNVARYNAPVHNREHSYLTLSLYVHLLSMHLTYYWLYFLFTSLLQLEYDQ